MNKRLYSLAVLLFLVPVVLFSQHKSKINWEQFLSQHDMTWNKLGENYYSGVITGNGLLGANLYKYDNNSLRLDIGRTDITDHRMDVDKLFGQARMPIGKFILTPAGNIQSVDIRLSLWNAEADGTITTDKGSIQFKTFVHALKNAIIFQATGSGEEKNFQWQWMADTAISPRAKPAFSYSNPPAEYLSNPNPPYRIYTQDGFSVCEQQLKYGGSYATVWNETQKNNTRTLFINIDKSDTEQTNAAGKAIKELRDIETNSWSALLKSHRNWWHQYYPASFLSIPDKRLESFYWIQQYKLASATRPEKNILDLMGPWMTSTPWPAIWWNLNIQLTYSPVFTANRQDFSKPIWKAFDEFQSSLINNVHNTEWRKDAIALGRTSSYNLVSELNPALAEINQYETGNLPWVLYYYWQYCTYTMNKDELLNKFYPLLRKSMRYYLYIIQKDDDGYYHLPLTASPEYKPAKDCNYDLSLLRWGLQTLLEINNQYKLNDDMQAQWQEVLAKLTPYPVDKEQGFMIGANVPLASSHRHYSHMLMIYPLYLVNWDQPQNHAVIEKSLYHWIGKREALQGYSFTGAASIFAMMNKGDSSILYLNNLLNRFIQPNTLYRESGPVIETPLAAAATLQEMLLQCWGGKIRVFPAIPSQWKDCAFDKFRAPGAFLVSAKYSNGKTDFIDIFGEAGGECIVQTGIPAGQLSSRHPFTIVDETTGTIKMQIKRGTTVTIRNNTYKDNNVISPINRQDDKHYYGRN